MVSIVVCSVLIYTVGACNLAWMAVHVVSRLVIEYYWQFIQYIYVYSDIQMPSMKGKFSRYIKCDLFTVYALTVSESIF